MKSMLLPENLERSECIQDKFDAVIATPGSARHLDFGTLDAPEPGDWAELARRHNSLEIEPLPSQAYVWGAGTVGQEIMQRLMQAGIRVLGVVERNPRFWAADTSALPCFSPDELLSRSRAPVMVGVHNPGVEYGPILEHLQLNGFEAWLPQRLWRAAALNGLAWPHAMWLDFPFWGRQDREEALAEMREAFALMADEDSVRVFWGELCARALGDARFRAVPEGGQYAPESLPGWQQPIRLIDGGAYDGDTLRFLLQRGLSVTHCLCFEPDPVNFEKLQSFRPAGIEMMCWPLGLSDQARVLRFDAGNGEASRLSNEGGTVVQCVGLDQSAPDYPATLLKLDIEGGELDALRGAERLIRQSGCAMAVSVYHAPDHLWKVPLLMHRLAPLHPIFMRAHALNGFETVAYALSPEVRDFLRC